MGARGSRVLFSCVINFGLEAVIIPKAFLFRCIDFRLETVLLYV